MKNLKRALSFALASVMVIGMMVVGAGAAFTDAEKITNDEAVDVMVALGVIAGKDNGSFDPEGTLTRAEAAKIITFMLLGPDKAKKLGTTAVSFTDVAADHWAASYIGYCSNMGILSGKGDGTFGPSDELTGLAFGKMLLVALGYDAKTEGYTGSNDWGINVAVDMVEAGIDLGDDVAMDDPISRENACLMAFKALTATMVKYAGSGTTITTADGTTIVTDKGAAVAQTWTTSGYDYTAPNEGNVAGNAGETIQFCEKYFNQLKKDTTADNDDFDRPGYTWLYKGEKVTFATETAKFVYTSNLNTTSGKKAIAADLKGYKFNGTEIKTKDTTDTAGATVHDLTVAAGGVIVDAVAALTANGKVVEIYVDSNKNITDVNTIVYKVAKITSVSTNKAGDVTYTVNNSVGTLHDYADDYANDDDVVLHGTFAKNDYVLAVTGVNSSDVHLYPTTKITGTQSANDGTNLTIDSTTYKLGKGVSGYNSYTYDNSTKAANYFLDSYGYVVASSEVSSDLTYAVVNKIAAKNTTTGLSTGKSAEAEIVLPDGTKSVVAVSKINGIKTSATAFTVSDTTPGITWTSGAATAVTVSATVDTNTAFNGQIVSYVVDSNGKYELTFAETPATETSAAGGTLTNKGVPAFGAQTATNSTVYVVATTKDSSTVFNSYTGFANVPTIKATSGETVSATYVTENSKVVFVYIDATEHSNVGESTVNNVYYVTGTTVTTVGTGSDKYWTLNGILDGEKTTIKSKVEDFKVVSGSDMTADTFYDLSINEDGYVTAATATTFGATGTADDTLIDNIADGSFAGYLWNDKTEVYVIDDGEVSVGTVDSIAVGDAYKIILPTTYTTVAEQNTISVLYIVAA